MLTDRPNTVQRIRSRGNQLIVGFLPDHAPYTFLDENGIPAGFEPAVVRAVAKRWGVEVTFVPVTSANRLPRLLAGQVDLLAAALPHTLANELVADFSADYLRDESALLIPAESQITNVQELAGKTVAVVQGAAALTQLETELTNLAVDVLWLTFPGSDAALAALKAGQVDALLGDRAHLTVVASEELSLSVLLPLQGHTYFGLGTSPGDSTFRAMLNATLQELYASGEYGAIYAEWFPPRLFPHVAATLQAMPTLLGSWPYTFDTLPVASVAVSTSRLSALRTRGKLLVGVADDLPPFGFLDQTGAVAGFEIDLVREFARRWLGDAEAIEFVRVMPDTAIPLLRAGQVDLLATALPQSWLRTTEVDFSSIYYRDSLGVLTRHADAGQTIAELAGQTLATVAGISGWRTIVPLLANRLAAEPTVLPFHEYRTAEKALLAEQIDAVIGSTAILSQIAAASSDLALLPESLGSLPYGIAVPHADVATRDLVNITLQTMYYDGTYATLYQQWFGDRPPPAPLLWLERELAQPPAALFTTLQSVDRSVPEVANALAAMAPRQLRLEPVAMQSPSNDVVSTSIPMPSTAATVGARLQATPTTVPVPKQPTTTMVRPTATPAVAQSELNPAGVTRDPSGTATNAPLATAPVADSAVAGGIATDATETDVTETDVTETDVTETDVTQTDITVADRTVADRTETDVTADATEAPAVPVADASTAMRPATRSTLSNVDTPVPTATATRVIAPTATPLPALVVQDEPLEVVLTKIAEPTAPATSATTGSLPPTVTILGTTNINVRVQPTTSAPIFKVIGGGTSWQTVALSADGEWIQILLAPGVSGWVARHLVAEAADFEQLTPTALPAATAGSAVAAITPTPRPLSAAATTHQVRSTDSLTSIAQEHYGSQGLWRLIYDSNRTLIGDNPNIIPTGAELVIPAVP